MIYLINNETPFPSPDTASEEGIVAFGGSLSPTRLIEAYSQGIFPWYNEGDPILWWCPDPRFVLFPEKLHIGKNMRKLLRKAPYRVTYNRCFTEVMQQCATVPCKDQHGTWIHPELIEAYTTLHRQGIAHSVEVWQDETLVGGLYGLQIGKIFCGESMFSKQPNASQYGFITFLQSHSHIALVDCQIHSEYLESLGAEEIPRATFLKLLTINH